MNLKSEFQNSKWPTVTPRVFDLADYESEVRISKFKIADNLTNSMPFFRSDYVIWKNLGLGFVYMKII